MRYAGTYCEVCKEKIDELYNCLCTKDKPLIREAINWFLSTTVFSSYESQQLIILLKSIDTPIHNLDYRREVHHQLAAAVAAIKASYLYRRRETERKLDVLRERLYLKKRQEYESTKTKTWKSYEKEINLDQEYITMKKDLDRYTVAYMFLEDLTKILDNRGNVLNKMSDDRRQMRRMVPQIKGE